MAVFFRGAVFSGKCGFSRDKAIFPGKWRLFSGIKCFSGNGNFPGKWRLFGPMAAFFPAKCRFFRAYGCFSGNGEFSGHMSVFSEIMAAFFREYVRFCTERRLCYADRPLSRCRVTFFPACVSVFPGKAINSVLSKLMLK